MYLRFLSLAIFTVLLLGSNASAQLTNFSEDFEGLDRTSPTALSDAGWQGAASGLTPSGGFQFFAGFVAPNNIDAPQLSIVSDTASGTRLNSVGLPMEILRLQLATRSRKPFCSHWIQTTTSTRPTISPLIRLRLQTAR